MVTAQDVLDKLLESLSHPSYAQYGWSDEGKIAGANVVIAGQQNFHITVEEVTK